jgi:hypothetical protein
MKCIKAIKDGKYSVIGDIIRVSDTDADQKVETGYWMFIPKSEWKSSFKKEPQEVPETPKKKKSKKS